MDTVGAVLSTVLWEAEPINLAVLILGLKTVLQSVVISVPRYMHILNEGDISCLQFSLQTVELHNVK